MTVTTRTLSTQIQTMHTLTAGIVTSNGPTKHAWCFSCDVRTVLRQMRAQKSGYRAARAGPALTIQTLVPTPRSAQNLLKNTAKHHKVFEIRGFSKIVGWIER